MFNPGLNAHGSSGFPEESPFLALPEAAFAVPPWAKFFIINENFSGVILN